jgi:hypothetical protein
MSEENDTQQEVENPVEEPQVKYDVNIKSNTQKTVFINVFELEMKPRIDGAEPLYLIYTRYHNESSAVPGIPEALPTSFSIADSNGNSVTYTPETNYDLLYAIETSINKYVETNNEKLKQGALELAKVEDSAKDENEN